MPDIDEKRRRAKTTLNKHNTKGSFAAVGPDPSIDLDKPISWTPPKGGGTIPAGTRAAIRERMKRHPVDAQNIIDMYVKQSTQEERDLGKDWYPNASRIVEALAAHHGVSRATAAGLIANYSPQKPWGQNLIEASEALRRMQGIGGKGNRDNPLSGKGVMATDAQRGNADEVLGRRLGIEVNADDVFAPKYGVKGTAGGKSAGQALKIRNFFRLIYRGEDPDAVVVDRHAYGVARGIAMTEAEYTTMTPSSDALYNEAAQAYREAAQRLSMRLERHVTPGEVQAVTWLTRQRLNKGASSVRETLGKQDWLNLKAYVKRHLPEMQSVFFEGGATTGYNLAFAVLDDIDLANDHWRSQPRDPGGENGGQWVKSPVAEISRVVKATFAPPGEEIEDRGEHVLEDIRLKARELHGEEDQSEIDDPASVKQWANDAVFDALRKRMGRADEDPHGLWSYAVEHHAPARTALRRGAVAPPVDQHLAVRAGVRDAIDMWATTSLDHHVKALFLQRAVAERFGLTEAYEHAYAYATDSSKPGAVPHDIAEIEAGMDDWEKHRDWYHALVEAMYEATQEDLATRGITELRLYRGMNLKQADLGDADQNGVWEMEFNPASSWSASKGTAKGFGAGIGETIFEIVVPAASVFSSAGHGIGCLEETEFVLLGGKHEVKIERAQWLDQMTMNLATSLRGAGRDTYEATKAWNKTANGVWSKADKNEALDYVIAVYREIEELSIDVLAIATGQVQATSEALAQIQDHVVLLRNARDDLRAFRARHPFPPQTAQSVMREIAAAANEKAAWAVLDHSIASTLKNVEDWLREADARRKKKEAALLAKYEGKYAS